MAIHNFLFARATGGTFVLRIEDTDVDRSRQEFVDVILEGLTWLGIRWDEGPVYQSERQGLYAPYVEQLLNNGRAYRCVCTPEDLAREREEARARKQDWKYSGRCRGLSDDEIRRLGAEGRPAAVRLAVTNEGETAFDDLIGGTFRRRNEDIEDFVIARSDGRALYNFAVVVDDHLMEISHVIRGNDHINNTYKQVLLYQALEWDIPQFAHAPLILRPDKSKVSKRKGDPSVIDYRDQGYLSDALLNFLCLLGWSPGDNREIFSLEELIAIFQLERVSQSNPILDPIKLEWMNGEYIRQIPVPDLAGQVRPFVVRAGLATESDLVSRATWFEQVVAQLQERCKTLVEFSAAGAFFFRAPSEYDVKGVEKHFSKPGVSDRLRRLAEAWNKTADFESETIGATMRALAEKDGTKLAVYIHPARLALTGATAGPGLFELAALLGREECLARLQHAASAIDSGLGSSAVTAEENA